MFLKMKTKNELIRFSFIFLLLLSFTFFSFSEETEDVNEQTNKLEEIIHSSSAYSDFHTSMLLKSAQGLMDAGISYEDTEEILINSVDNSLNAYSIKKVFDIIQETREEGLPSESIINKFNEGLAKNIDNNTIMTVITTKAEKLKKAEEILNEAKEEGLEINGGEELLKVLSDSLENDVPENSLSWLLSAATSEGKNVKEITEISEEFSYLSLMAYDLGLSPDRVAVIFEEAMEGNTAIADICENIQNNLELEISAAKVESTGGKLSTISTSSTPSASTAGTPTGIGETPIQDAGEPPAQTGGISEPSTSPGEDTPPPPEN